jgi:hypothetical protein
MHKMPFAISLLSVVVEARRVLASMGDLFERGGLLLPHATEGAKIVVLNKGVLMPTEDRQDLLCRLEVEYLGKEIFVLSTKTGEEVELWLGKDSIRRTAPARLIVMGYARYGVGEALLGWTNLQLDVGDEALPPRDEAKFLLELARLVSAGLSEAGAEVADFKMSLEDEEGRLGTMDQVIGDMPPDFSRSLGGAFRRVHLTVSLRAEGDSGQFGGVEEGKLEEAARGIVVSYRLDDVAAFQPGKPVPTARVASL